MSMIKNILIILLLIDSHTLAKDFLGDLRKGGWSGNGGGEHQDGENIWFLGEKPVSWCLTVADDYPLEEERVYEIVNDSINRWKIFFRKYGLDHAIFGFHKKTTKVRKNAPGTIQPSHADSPLKMSLQFEYTGICPNKSQSSPLPDQIQMVFGLSNKVINAYRQLNANHALGLTIRKSFNHYTYRNEGYLWIDNFTDDETQIRHMVLHELGHIFGMKHGSVSVMSEKVGDIFKTKYQLESIGKIESKYWPYRITPDNEYIIGSSTLFRPKLKYENKFKHEYTTNKNCNTNWLSTQTMPRGLQKLFRTDTYKCIKLKINMSSEGRHKIIKLTIETPRNENHLSIIGKFQPAQPEAMQQHPGPILYTLWSQLNNKKKFWKKIGLQPHLAPVPYSGFFIQPGSRRNIAARFTQDKGPELELFLPSGRWINIGRPHNSRPIPQLSED